MKFKLQLIFLMCKVVINEVWLYSLFHNTSQGLRRNRSLLRNTCWYKDIQPFYELTEHGFYGEILSNIPENRLNSTPCDQPKSLVTSPCDILWTRLMCILIAMYLLVLLACVSCELLLLPVQYDSRTPRSALIPIINVVWAVSCGLNGWPTVHISCSTVAVWH